MHSNVVEKTLPSPRHLMVVAACIAMTGIPCALMVSCASIFYTPVSQSLGIARSELTLYLSVMNVVMMVTLPLWGRVFSHVSKRVSLSAVAVCAALGFLGMSMGQAAWHFYICGALFGVALVPLLYLAVPTLINAWFARRAGFFVGLCMAFTGIGGVVFNIVGSAIIASGDEGWRLAYLAFAALTLVGVLPLTTLAIRDTPEELGLVPYGADGGCEGTGFSATADADEGPSAAKAMRMRSFWALFAFCGLITLNQNVFHLFASYASSFDKTAPQVAAAAGVVASVAMAGQALGKVLLGAINDRSVRAGVLFGMASGIAGATLMLLVPQRVGLLMLGAFLFGFAYAMTIVETPLLVRRVFGGRDYASIYSRVSMAGTLVGTVAVPGLSLLVEGTGSYTPVFLVSYVCLAACMGLSALALGGRRGE